MKILSLSGADGSGKSQQRRILEYYLQNEVTFTPPLVQFMGFADKTGAGFSIHWNSLSSEDFVLWIAESLEKRHQYAEEAVPNKDSVVIHERGCLMFVAVCLAALKQKGYSDDFNVITGHILEVFAKYSFYEHQEQELFLITEKKYKAVVVELLALSKGKTFIEDDQSEAFKRYQQYLKYLEEAISFVVRGFSCSTIVVDKAIIPINEEIRLWIKQASGLKFDHRLILNDDLRVYGFSGLSESGKSSHAQLLATLNGGYRLKLSFFDVATRRYANKKLRDEHVVLLLLDFMRSHYFSNLFTVESLHGIQLTAVLKMFFGDYFQVVYMECEKEVRVYRAAAEYSLSYNSALALVEKKDIQKDVAATEINKRLAGVVIDTGLGVSAEEAIEFFFKTSF